MLIGAIMIIAASSTAAAAAPGPVVSAGTVNGVAADIWTWTDSTGNPRTLALKKEGAGNSGHGGYAVQMTYYAPPPGGGVVLIKVTVNAAAGSDGGFGYFVSHERYRQFSDGAIDTIASHIFNKDDSPLGKGFAATTTMPAMPAVAGAERFTINYGHYGTIVPDPVNPNTGYDSKPLPLGAANYAFYTIPVSTTWVFQTGMDYPRIDVSADLSHITPPGGIASLADLVSFDMRGPYGVMVFDNGMDGTVGNVLWGDQEFLFALTKTPATRKSTWTWNVKNAGARYQALVAGPYEMGLYEPTAAAASATVDGWAGERGYTSASYAAAGGKSYSSCGGTETIPTDGEWPYQSLQYSLPCGSANLGVTTTGKKIAWGSTAFFGTSLSAVYNGQQSYAFNGFPAARRLAYSVCLVLGEQAAGVSLTSAAAAAYAKAKPVSKCATQAAP
jgi:hypothetical protein